MEGVRAAAGSCTTQLVRADALGYRSHAVQWALPFKDGCQRLLPSLRGPTVFLGSEQQLCCSLPWALTASVWRRWQMVSSSIYFFMAKISKTCQPSAVRSEATEISAVSVCKIVSERHISCPLPLGTAPLSCPPLR